MMRSCLLSTIGGCFGALAATLAFAQQHNMPAAKMSDEDIIKSATSAAPEAISKNATVIDIGADGKIRVVRKGTNNFTCMADNPNTPGPDPMCGDRCQSALNVDPLSAPNLDPGEASRERARPQIAL